MVVKKEEEIHPERNPVVRWFKRFMPVTSDYRGDKFFKEALGIGQLPSSPTLRQRLGWFVRKTLSFSKTEENHEASIKLFIHEYNIAARHKYLAG